MDLSNCWFWALSLTLQNLALPFGQADLKLPFSIENKNPLGIQEIFNDNMRNAPLHDQIAFRSTSINPPMRMPDTKRGVELSSADKSAIRQVIENQLEALRHGDFTRAYFFASPAIKTRFTSSEEFSLMIKSSYEIVLNPGAVVFEDLNEVMGKFAQGVLLFGPNGDTVVASYLMEKQDNGDWKIDGCYLAPLK